MPYNPIIKTNTNTTVDDWNSRQFQLEKLTTPDRTNELIIGTPPKLNPVYTNTPTLPIINNSITSNSVVEIWSANQGYLLSEKLKKLGG